MRNQSEFPPQRGRATTTRARTTPAEERPPERRLSLRQFRFHRRFVPVMLAITLLCTLGLAGVAYFGTRSLVLADAQTHLAQGAQVERQLLADQGAGVNLTGNRLVIGTDNNVITLNADTTLVDRTKSVIGANATIYQLEGPDLVAISTTLPVVNGGHTVAGARALGDKLTSSPFHALVGDCGAADSASCHHPYQGLATLHGVSYVTAFTPLYDMNGNFVGALGTATAYATVIAPCVALAVILLFIGLLMALVGVAMGLWAYGSSAGKMLDSLDTRLTRVADSAADLEYLARGQVERVERQNRMAQQVGEEARRLDTLAGALVQRQAELRDAAGAIWAEMSHPGAQPDGEAALRMARQTAVVSGQMGTDAGDARLHCRQLVTLMNHVTAEGEALGATGARMREHALDLRGAVEQVEVTVGERLLPRTPGDDARKPFFRWGRHHPNRPAPTPTAQPPHPITRKIPAIGDASASQPSYNTPRNAQTGAHRSLSAPTTGSLARQRPTTRPTPNGPRSTGRHLAPERPEPAISGPHTGQRRAQRPGDLGLPSLPEERRDSWRDISADFEAWE